MPVENEYPMPVSRRGFLACAAFGAVGALSACASAPPVRYSQPALPHSPETQPPVMGSYASMYAPVVDGGFQIPGVPVAQMDPTYLRQLVPDPTGEMPGTLVVDTSSHFLYLVLQGGQAMRYGVGLGREGFEWSGRGEIEWKQAWPRWFPPEEMIARQPELEQYRARQIPGTNNWEGGMPAGPTNPLGARALYIFQNGEDTLYRLHGNPEWNSIGRSVSSGCVRLLNQDVIDLYDRVPEKSPILVTSGLGIG